VQVADGSRTPPGVLRATPRTPPGVLRPQRTPPPASPAHALEHGPKTLRQLADAVLDVQLALLAGRQGAEQLAARPR
jgi:hypothetical protein